MRPIFITGIGTDVGKTLVAAIVTEALEAAYWKPIQAGYSEGTDSEWVSARVSNPRILPETYKLALPASPHIAAREEGVEISIDRITAQFRERGTDHQPLVVEGAGGLLVPLNGTQFVLDLAAALDAIVLLVSRNYLGSINHSLLTAAVCKTHGLTVAGWIFNDQYGHYEQEIAAWSGIPSIGSIPFTQTPDPAFIREQADRIREELVHRLPVKK